MQVKSGVLHNLIRLRPLRPMTPRKLRICAPVLELPIIKLCSDRNVIRCSYISSESDHVQCDLRKDENHNCKDQLVFEFPCYFLVFDHEQHPATE